MFQPTEIHLDFSCWHLGWKALRALQGRFGLRSNIESESALYPSYHIPMSPYPVLRKNKMRTGNRTQRAMTSMAMFGIARGESSTPLVYPREYTHWCGKPVVPKPMKIGYTTNYIPFFSVGLEFRGTLCSNNFISISHYVYIYIYIPMTPPLI